MHNSYIINGTESHDSFSFEEFYNIVSKKRSWFVPVKCYMKILINGFAILLINYLQ